MNPHHELEIETLKQEIQEKNKSIAEMRGLLYDVFSNFNPVIDSRQEYKQEQILDKIEKIIGDDN